MYQNPFAKNKIIKKKKKKKKVEKTKGQDCSHYQYTNSLTHPIKDHFVYRSNKISSDSNL